MQHHGSLPPTRTFFLGTDWWTDCDDCVALRILARAVRADKVTLAGIAINACMEYSVASLDGFLRTEGLSSIPIGVDADATDFGGNPPYQKRLAQYAHTYRSNADAEFDSGLIYELSVLRRYVAGLLEKVCRKRPDTVKAKMLMELVQLIHPASPNAVPGDSILRETIGGSQLEY